MGLSASPLPVSVFDPVLGVAAPVRAVDRLAQINMTQIMMQKKL